MASHWPAEEKRAHEVLRWHNQRSQAENFHKELKTGAGRVVLRLVLEAEALACWHTIRQRCWALGIVT